jgi:adenosylcobinamide kinase / adenosylcobinamide-phosphate guanylyltransferase
MYFILGGERSGKTAYAQELALGLSDSPVYVATSRPYDDHDFKQRVRNHKINRDERWINIEEEKNISSIDLSYKVAIIDCVTLWLSNFYAETGGNPELTLNLAKQEFDRIDSSNCCLIFISNELGMGVHAQTKSARKFVEIQGWMNQHIAKKADKVTLMVAGIPVQVKN